MKNIWNKYKREFVVLLATLVMAVVFTVLNSNFLNYNNFVTILQQMVLNGVLAVGMMFTIITGGIDLLVGCTYAITGIIVASCTVNYGMNPFLGILVGLVVGAVLGAFNGFLINKMKLQPFIATLGTMSLYRGLAYVISNSEWASAENLGTFKDFALGKVLGLNNVIWVMIIIYVIFFIVMKWTKVGRKVYAVGSNREAAAISGISTKRIDVLVYTVMGTLSGLCGALAVSIYASAQPNMLYGKEMDVIAACVIGGVSMQGGRGSVVGAFLGSLILAIIAKALPLVGIESIAQNTVKGIIIMAVIILNVLAQRAMDRSNLKGREM